MTDFQLFDSSNPRDPRDPNAQQPEGETQPFEISDEDIGVAEDAETSEPVEDQPASDEDAVTAAHLFFDRDRQDLADEPDSADDEPAATESESTFERLTGRSLEAVLEKDSGGKSAPDSADALDKLITPLRNRFPQATDGTLFCVHKLLQNPHTTIPDFRQEAALYGIGIGGRSLHSAKVLLGLAEEAPRKPRARKQPDATEASLETAPTEGSDNDLAQRIAGVVAAWQNENGFANVRGVLEEALSIIDDALSSGDALYD